MQRSITRIRTSHVGRLPPPKGWEDMPGRLASAEITDPAVIAAQITPAITETVKRQVEVGIDCIGDGEFWTARSLAIIPRTSLALRRARWRWASRPPPGTRPASATNFPISTSTWTMPETLFLVPGEKPMPPVTARVVARSPVKIEGARSHQSPARHLQRRDRALGYRGRGGFRGGARTGLARPFHLQ